MIIWQGWGVLVVVFAVAALLAAQALVNAIGGPGNYEANSALWGGVALLLAGAVTVAVGVRLNGRPGRVFIDEQSGQRVEAKPRHSLFWIKMEYWGAVLSLGGLVMIVAGMLG